MMTNAEENLLSMVENGPVYIAGNADDASIAARIEALRATGPKDEPKGSCNMGWGWGN